MRQPSKQLIAKFYIKDQKRLVFQLTIDQNGTYHIKRGTVTILTVQEEEKARKGFNRLREKWATGKQIGQ